MKLKNYIAILATLPVLAGFVGCKSDDQPEAKPAKEILMVMGGDVIQYRADETGPARDVNIQADCRWTVVLDAGNFGDNISVSPRQGNGNGTLVISSDQNTVPGLLREATITLVSDGGLRQKVTVRQTGGDDALNLSQTAFTFAAAPTTAQLLTISSNTAWQLQVPSGTNWVHFSHTSSTDAAGPVQVTVDNAVTDAQRTASIAVVYGGGKTASFEVVQEGMTTVNLSVPTQGLNFGATPDGGIVNIQSNAQWTAFIPTGDNWLRFEDTGEDGITVSADGHSITGVGNSEVKVFCEENNTTRDRLSSVIVIAGTKNPKQSVVMIEQARNGSAQPLQTSVSIGQLSVTRNSATLLVNIASEEVVGDFGLLYSTTSQMPVVGSAEQVIVGRGGTSLGLTYELTGLQENTTYYVRAFVNKDSNGEIVYSEPIAVTTAAAVIDLGSIMSIYVSNTTAEVRFAFTSDIEVVGYGFVYSATNQQPSSTDGTMVAVGSGSTGRNVMGTIANLQESTTYYVRGYVQTQDGHLYTPNTLTITTSASVREPGESDNPDPSLAPRR